MSSGEGAGDGFGTVHWPTEIRLKKEEKRLEVDFDDGRTFSYPAEFLRVVSPSAEVQGHNPSQKQTVGGRRHVGIMRLEPVGNYAIRIVFDDLHDSGIYSWKYLYEIGTEQETLWAGYLDELQAKGLSRDPRR
ncbi:gamma-butyrobetaine hydroxylase-like domain-containing protein [Azospirillum endophyticum]